MPTACEYLFNTLLAASASRIGSSTESSSNPKAVTNSRVSCGLLFPIVGRQNSSTAGNYRPLEEMESQASELYDAQLQDYEQDDDNDAKPVQQRRLLNNVTSSTKIRLHGQNPRSC